MAIYVSVISHNHCELIEKLSCLIDLSRSFQVVIKSNTPNDEFSYLCERPNFHWVDENYYLGFGHNNNLVFNYCCNELGMGYDDYFIVLNPDVKISTLALNKLIEIMEEEALSIAAINLFKDELQSEYDNSIRTFPTLLQFITSFLGFGNHTIVDKSKLTGVTQVDWAAGSFLAFKSSYYAELKGFDEGYFMYCEDIDICYRSYLKGVSVSYFSDIKAIHFAAHANRNIFSKHFVWHVSSVFRFILSRLGLIRLKSSIN